MHFLFGKVGTTLACLSSHLSSSIDFDVVSVGLGMSFSEAFVGGICREIDSNAVRKLNYEFKPHSVLVVRTPANSAQW